MLDLHTTTVRRVRINRTIARRIIGKESLRLYKIRRIQTLQPNGYAIPQSFCRCITVHRMRICCLRTCFLRDLMVMNFILRERKLFIVQANRLHPLNSYNVRLKVIFIMQN